LAIQDFSNQDKKQTPKNSILIQIPPQQVDLCYRRSLAERRRYLPSVDGKKMLPRVDPSRGERRTSRPFSSTIKEELLGHLRSETERFANEEIMPSIGSSMSIGAHKSVSSQSIGSLMDISSSESESTSIGAEVEKCSQSIGSLMDISSSESDSMSIGAKVARSIVRSARARDRPVIKEFDKVVGVWGELLGDRMDCILETERRR
jgi:hypothetical protein